jgi:hypothetical protein
MSALTLLEQSKAITNPQAQAIVNAFALEFDINSRIPYVSMTGYDLPFTVFDALPTIAPRDFNADFTSDYGTSSQYRVPWKNYGGKLEVDRAMKKGNPAGAAIQLQLQVAAIAKKWAAHAIEGAGSTELNGLNTFINTFWTGQRLDASASASGGLITIDMIDELLSLVDNPSVIYCSEIVSRKITSLARTATVHNIVYTKPEFGAPILTYAGIPVVTMRDADTGDDILSTVEIDGAATNSNTSSVYAIRFGEDGFHGFAPGGVGLDVTETNPGTNYDVTRLEKNAGVALKHKRGAARLRYVKQALT